MFKDIFHRAQDLLHLSERDEHPQLKWSDTRMNYDEIAEMQDYLTLENKSSYEIAPFPLIFASDLSGSRVRYIMSILAGASTLEDQGKLVFKSFRAPGEDGQIAIARKDGIDEIEALVLLLKTIDLAEPGLKKLGLPTLVPPRRNIFTLNK